MWDGPVKTDSAKIDWFGNRIRIDVASGSPERSDAGRG
jgi:hypothetical protein